MKMDRERERMTAPAVQRTTELLGLLVVLTAVAVLPWSLYQLSSLHPRCVCVCVCMYVSTYIYIYVCV